LDIESWRNDKDGITRCDIKVVREVFNVEDKGWSKGGGSIVGTRKAGRTAEKKRTLTVEMEIGLCISKTLE